MKLLYLSEKSELVFHGFQITSFFPRDFNKLYRNSLNYYLIIFINIYNIHNLYTSSLKKKIIIIKKYKILMLRAVLVMISGFIHFFILLFVIIFYGIW